MPEVKTVQYAAEIYENPPTGHIDAFCFVI
jgi:hypothetical protein